MSESRTDPTSQIRYLKITATVEVKVEDGKWIARSKSLDLCASGDSPEDAMKVLEDYIVSGERSVHNPNVKQYVSKKAKVVAEKVADEVKEPEDDSSYEDAEKLLTGPEGETDGVKIPGLSFGVDDIMAAKKPRLIEMCRETGVPYSTKNVPQMQADLFAFLTAGDEKIGEVHE